MFQKIKKYSISFIKNNYKLIIFYVIFFALFTIKLDYQIYIPGGLINLEKRVEIKKSYNSEGTLNLTYVKGKPATIPMIIMSYILPSWDLISNEENRIENETANEITIRNKLYMDEVNQNSLIVAFRSLNKEYKIKNMGVVVLHVMDESKTNLKIGDIIISANDVDINLTKDLTDIVKESKVGDKISITVKRNKKLINCYAYVTKINDDQIIGIYLTKEIEITTLPEVNFKFKNNESGPSGGLMVTLQIYDMLTKEDITKGKKISGTGTIEEDGTVGEISGIKYKLSGAVKNKADVFICPKENFKEALKLKNKYNYKIDIIGVSTFKEAVEKLSEL